MVDTFAYTPKTVTHAAPHARDYIDLKRVMSYVVVATIPCILMAFYNTGLQANNAIAALGPESISGWRAEILMWLGVSFSPDNFLACMAHGALYFFPIYITTLVVGGLWEVLFSTVRGHEVNEGFLVTSMLYT
ncbi:MAG: RnfABCDGE type electron transport complex subunit D, partial [Gammaproteobacteria bacterium]|nr:RnfABCDGE type electron transport complex subunit D [Gammaproteobacteria bacterium]